MVYMVLFYVTESFFKLDYCSIKYISSYISYFTIFVIAHHACTAILIVQSPDNCDYSFKALEKIVPEALNSVSLEIRRYARRSWSLWSIQKRLNRYCSFIIICSKTIYCRFLKM